MAKTKKEKKSDLGRGLAKSRWDNSSEEEKSIQVKKMVDGKKKFWDNLSPKDRSERMKLVRARKKHATI